MRTIPAILGLLLLCGCAQDHDPAIDFNQRRIILFDGNDTSAWVGKTGEPCAWRVVDGALESTDRKGDIQTKEKYLDYTLHLEFRTPQPKEGQTGQNRGNSGVFLDNKYEIQILESYGIDPITQADCGAIYRQKAPDVNAAKPPLQWQTYHIIFRAPRFDAVGKKTENARVTLIWNDRKVHDDVEITGPTRKGDTVEVPGPGVIRLQDHGHPVQFRNIWIVPVSE